MSRKHKMVCTTLNKIDHFNILASTITGYVSISAFSSLVGIPIGITSSAKRLKVCEIAAGSKKFKSIIKKKKKRHDKIALLAKFKLNSIEVLMTQALSILLISHDESVLINKVHQRLYSIYKAMLSFCLQCRKNTWSKNTKIARTKNGRILLLSKCEKWKWKCIKQQKASGLLSILGIKTPINKIPLLSPLLF